MSIDTKFFKHLEESFPGRDMRRTQGRRGAAPSRHVDRYTRRGSVLTIDLTNRCNMMCDPASWTRTRLGLCTS